MDLPPPEHPLGSFVRVVLNDRNRTPRRGRVREVVWHFKDGRYNYYIEENGQKVTKRYLAEDLIPAEPVR